MADDDQESTAPPFLARWSQRKQEARQAPPAVQPAAADDTPAPPLPPVDELTPASDFSGFMHPKVDADLRRAALRKLFSDPHFNVMDGLDTYVADYSQPDPLPPGMLAGLRQAQNILAWAKETKVETAARFAPPPDVPVMTPATGPAQLTGSEVAPANEPASAGAPPVAEPAARASAADTNAAAATQKS